MRALTLSSRCNRDMEPHPAVTEKASCRYHTPNLSMLCLELTCTLHALLLFSRCRLYVDGEEDREARVLNHMLTPGAIVHDVLESQHPYANNTDRLVVHTDRSTNFLHLSLLLLYRLASASCRLYGLFRFAVFLSWRAWRFLLYHMGFLITMRLFRRKRLLVHVCGTWMVGAIGLVCWCFFSRAFFFFSCLGALDVFFFFLFAWEPWYGCGFSAVETLACVQRIVVHGVDDVMQHLCC